MSRLRLPAFHDVARLIGRDADETEANLYHYYANPFSAFFSYRCARSNSRYAYGHMLGLPQILQSCDQERTNQGRVCNADVLRHLWRLGDGRSLRTYELAPRFLNIRNDLVIRVVLPFYYVEDGQARAFWLQPRKEYALNLSGLALLASMVKAAVLVDDFRDVDFEVCDMSAPAAGKERKPTIYRLNSFEILSEEETVERLQFLAIAHDRLVARGVERSKRVPKQQPPAGPDLFSK